MKKRILIFSTAYFPLVGGAEVAVKEITDRLSDFEFVMITARLDSKLPLVEKIGNIEVHRLGNRRHSCRIGVPDGTLHAELVYAVLHSEDQSGGGFCLVQRPGIYRHSLPSASMQCGAQGIS